MPSNRSGALSLRKLGGTEEGSNGGKIALVAKPTLTLPVGQAIEAASYRAVNDINIHLDSLGSAEEQYACVVNLQHYLAMLKARAILASRLREPLPEEMEG